MVPSSAMKKAPDSIPAAKNPIHSLLEPPVDLAGHLAYRRAKRSALHPVNLNRMAVNYADTLSHRNEPVPPAELRAIEAHNS
jgi:hypothetical protein